MIFFKLAKESLYDCCHMAKHNDLRQHNDANLEQVFTVGFFI